MRVNLFPKKVLKKFTVRKEPGEIERNLTPCDPTY